MNLYRIPKQRVAVDIALRGRESERVNLFLADSAESHLGAERPSDVVNRRDRFLAVEGTSGVEVLHRGAVDWIAVPAELERDADDAISGGEDTAFALAIDLEGGRSLKGVARYALPDSARRLQDLLNHEEPFLRVEIGQKMLLVNKEHILRVRERPGEGA